MLATNEACSLPAQPESLPHLHEVMARFWASVEAVRGHRVPSHIRHGLATAVAEVGANIIRHSQAKSFDFILVLRDEDTVEARFEDAGVPFGAVPYGEFDPHMLPEGGMGLTLAKRALHALEYRRLPNGTNCWTLVVLLPVSK
ncbi:MAG: ATP-binding protein [Pseudomonadota bacterium]|nr:ATP-binding protein [Pseudomonadota bacterium]